jgi:hypothetical protein
MEQHGMTWPDAAASTEPTVWDGRAALQCRWQGDVDGEAIFDIETGLPVRTTWPDKRRISPRRRTGSPTRSLVRIRDRRGVKA